MHLTIIAGEQVSSLDVPPDMELENFVALCKLELPAISDVPLEKLALNCSGRQFVANSELDRKPLQDLNIRDGDAIHFGVVSAASSSRSTPSSSSPNQLISALVQGLRVPSKKRGLPDSERAQSDGIFEMLAEPFKLDYLRAEYPDLVAAYEANPTDKDAFYAAYKRNKEEMARRIRLMHDETSAEGQLYVAKMIEKERIERMHDMVMEHMPEAFIPVTMLYIRMAINNVPVIAFVDSGAQTSIMSESCARRCNILNLVDRRYRLQAVGIGGTQKMVGRIYACQVQVNENIFTCPFEVMADRDIDILFGLNTLMRHKCCIDLAQMVLRFGDGTETRFLNEEEIRREKEAVEMGDVLAKVEEAEKRN